MSREAMVGAKSVPYEHAEETVDRLRRLELESDRAEHPTLFT